MILISNYNRNLHGKHSNFRIEPDRQQLNKQNDTKIINHLAAGCSNVVYVDFVHATFLTHNNC